MLLRLLARCADGEDLPRTISLVEGRNLLGRASRLRTAPRATQVRPLAAVVAAAASRSGAMIPDRDCLLSREHVAIEVSDRSVTVEVLSGSSPTYISGERAQRGERRELRSGQTLALGEAELEIIYELITTGDGDGPPADRPPVPHPQPVVRDAAAAGGAAHAPRRD